MPPSSSSNKQPPGVPSAENVAYIASTTSSQNHRNQTDNKELPVQATDPHAVDGDITVKSGAVPPTAWESSAAELAKVLLGKTLGSFTIEAALGSGGMAAVFRAYDPLLDRQVALKILPPALARQADQVQRFEREAKAAAKLDDEHVARVHQYGHDQGLHYIAYEFVEGVNLRELMEKQGGRLPVINAVCYIMQAAQGLAHAAARGIVHRDIKPSNLVVTQAGQVKLVDLGLARQNLVKDTDQLTHSGATLGTFDYLAPEQALDPSSADLRSDIYSLGCTLYHCVTGRAPVPQGTAAQKLHAHQHEKFADPRDFNSEIPPALVEILKKMLAKVPNDRYQTAEQLVSDLQKLADTFSVSSPADRNAVVTQTEEPDRLRYLWIVGLIVLMAGIWGGNAWLSSYEKRPAGSGKPASELAQRDTSSKVNNESSSAEPSPFSDAATTEKMREPVSVEVSNTAELLQAFSRNDGGTIILTEGLYELQPDASEGIAITIRKGDWQIQPAEGVRPVLRLNSVATELPNGHAVLFDVRGGTLHLSRAVIELNETSSSDTPVGFVVGGGATLDLVDCELKQLGAGKESSSNGRSDTTMIQLTSGRGNGSVGIVRCQGCLLHGGSRAVEQVAAGLVEWENCWIGPYQQTFVLPALSGSDLQRRILTFKQCCVALAKQACFAIAGASPVQLKFDHTLFSRCGSSNRNTQEGVWLLKDATSTAPIDVHAARSCFYRVNGFYAVDSGSGNKEVLVRDWSQLRSVLPLLRNEGSLVLNRSPWVDSKPWQHFQENGQLSMLALKDDFHELGTQTLLGQPLPSITAASQNPANTASPPAKTTRTLIVDGRGDDPGTFITLNSAIGSITDDEETTIIVQLPGTVPIKPSELGNSRIIIKPGEGVTPELVFHRDTVSGPDGEAVLFRIHDGELTLDNMRVRLDALRDQARSLAVAAISGAGKCRFKDSIITLKGSADLSLMACLVTDPTGMMNQSGGKSPRTGMARLEVVESLVRGSGDLLHVQTSRPFGASLQQSGVALDGTALVVDGNKPDMTMAGDGAQVQLDHATLWCSKGFLHLHGTPGMPQLVPVRVQSSSSLLATSEAQPLIRVDGNQNESELKRRLTWFGKRNCYAASGPMITAQAFDKETMASQYDATYWSEMWGGDDEQAQIVKTAPLAGINRSANVSEWEPRDWAPKVDDNSMLKLRDIGVSPDQLPSVHTKP
jgi:serine/threonine protein kinase